MTRSGSKGISQSTETPKPAGDTPNEWAARYWKHWKNATIAQESSRFLETGRNKFDKPANFKEKA